MKIINYYILFFIDVPHINYGIENHLIIICPGSGIE